MDKLKNIVLTQYLLMWGNSLGIKTNFLYYLQHQLSSLMSGPLNIDDDSAQKGEKLKEDGMVVVGKTDVSQMAKIVSAYCSKKKTDKNGVVIMDRKSAGKLAPYLYKALGTQVEKVLNSYFGSHFQFYWISAIRYKKAKVSAMTSFGYHIDDNPKELMKIFFYLNDTYEWNAAFRSFDYHTSQDLIQRGFKSSTGELRAASQKYITSKLEKKKLRIVEGKKGTVFVFDNNLVHKGSTPKRGYRDVVVVEVYPSSKRFDLESVKKALVNPYKTDYPPNPFVNDVIGA